MAEYSADTQGVINRTRTKNSKLVNDRAPDGLLQTIDKDSKVMGYYTPIELDKEQPLKQCGGKANDPAFVPSILAANTAKTDGSASDSNTRSIVLRIRFGNVNFVFPGDATELTEKFALKNYPKGHRVTVLAASHHGAETDGSNSLVWANYMKPAIVIYNAGPRKGYYHPRCSVLENYAENNKQLLPTKEHIVNCGDDTPKFVAENISQAQYKTSDQGDITVKANADSIISVDCETPGEFGCGLMTAIEVSAR